MNIRPDIDLVVDGDFGGVYEGLFGLTLDAPAVDTVEVDEVRNYPQFRDVDAGKVFNRRSALLHIKWGRVQGKPVLRLSLSRVKGRGEDDERLLSFDFPCKPGEDGKLRHPRQYIFQALKEAKKQFSDKVGCCICGKPDLWFKKIQTPQYPLYRVMWKEIDFADTNHRICRDCDKLINRRAVEFNPVPELDDDGHEFDSIFADSVSEPFNIRKDIQYDNIDFRVALDAHASKLQLGGSLPPPALF